MQGVSETNLTGKCVVSGNGASDTWVQVSNPDGKDYYWNTGIDSNGTQNTVTISSF